MGYIDKVNVQDTVYDIRDSRLTASMDALFQYGEQDFYYGDLAIGGIDKNNAPTRSGNQRRSDTYWPVVDGPVTVQMSGGLTGYLRLYNTNKELLVPADGLPGATPSNKVITIAKNGSLTLTMTDYNPSAAYFRFHMSAGDISTYDANSLVRENARIILGKPFASAAELAETSQQVTANAGAINDLVSDVDAHEQSITELEADTATLKTDTATLKSQALPNVWGLFHNAVCIGDSLTRGYYASYKVGQRNRDYGYPNALARMTGMHVWNFGASGADSKTWLENSTFARVDYSNFDVAFICLGTNLGQETPRTEADYGTYYLQILDRLKDANENMVIFCLSVPHQVTRSTWIQNYVAQYTAQSQAARHQHVYYLDILSVGLYKDPAHIDATDNTHFDAVGYSLLAESVKIAVEKLYAENPTGIFVAQTKDAFTTDSVNAQDDNEKRIAQLTKEKSELTWILETLSLTGYRAIPQEVVPGGVSSTGDNNSAGAKEVSRRTGFLPVIENPVIANVNNGITAYIRLYDANKALVTLNTTKDGTALPGANSTYNYIQINKSTSPMNINMRDYNADAVYYRFIYTCGTNSTDLLTDQCAFLATHKNLVTNGEMQTYVDEQIASVMALIATL